MTKVWFLNGFISWFLFYFFLNILQMKTYQYQFCPMLVKKKTPTFKAYVTNDVWPEQYYI